MHTKTLLADSLKKMVLKKPFSKITISDITEDCGMNRMTFYYHFQDIEDLVEWVLKEDLKKATFNKRTIQTWKEGLLNIFELFSANRTFVLTVYRNLPRAKIQDYLFILCHDFIYDIIEVKSKGINISKEDKGFIADFYKYAFVGTLMTWLKGDMKEEPKKIVERVNLVIEGNLDKAIARFSKQLDKI